MPSPRLSGLRVGTRLLLLLLVPMSALLVVTGIANWRGLRQVHELSAYQRATKAGGEISDIADAIARERAATIRARIVGTPVAAASLRSRRRIVDGLIANVPDADRRTDAGDIGGRLDAVSRQLFALRLRARSLTLPAIQTDYGQTLDGLEALQRALAARPPTRDVATASTADLAMRSAVEAARREQLDVWTLLRRPGNAGARAPGNTESAALERAALNAFRSWASSSATANLNAALFSAPGLFVRQQRADLRSGDLAAGPTAAARWWQQAGARLGALGRVRTQSRAALTATIQNDLSSERASVAWRLTLSLVAVATGLGLGLLLRRSITWTLRDLSRGAQALSNGQFDVEINSAGGDEIAEVGAALKTVRTTNLRLVTEVHAMNHAIATKRLTRRAPISSFQGAWAELLEGMNGTMVEVARLHAAERREIERQEVFGIVGRHVVSGDLATHEIYAKCCGLLVDHVGAMRAELYEKTADGWQRRAIAGRDASPWPASHEFTSAGCRPDASRGVMRVIRVVHEDVGTVLTAEFVDAAPLEAADLLFIEGTARLLDEAANHRRAELERVRAQQLEATGTLAATFAHDFNNVLGAILNHARLGELETQDREAAAAFHAIGAAVSRASEVVDRLLRFSRAAPPADEPFDLAALVEEACDLVRPGLPRSIAFECQPDHSVPAIVGDPNRIHQVVVNLITNAAQALGSSPGQITVVVDQTAAPADDAELIAAGPFARVRVHDTGPGIPPSVAKRIFDPFFTTKPEGQGTGLGLASARIIAREHQGTLELQSSPDAGTTATLCLPIRAHKQAAFD